MNDDLYPEIVLELHTDSDCNLVAIDRTDYSAIGFTDFTHHALCEFVAQSDINSNEIILYKTITPFTGNSDPLITQSDVYKLNSDGVYIYRRMILPISDPNGYYVDSDSDGVYHIYYLGNIVDDIMSVYNNAHDYGQNILIGEILDFIACRFRKCLFKAQQESINTILNSGCDFTCKSTDDTYKRDFLLAANLVMDYYVQLGDIKKAQALLNRLTECGSFCSDTTLTTYDCGCK